MLHNLNKQVRPDVTYSLAFPRAVVARRADPLLRSGRTERVKEASIQITASSPPINRRDSSHGDRQNLLRDQDMPSECMTLNPICVEDSSYMCAATSQRHFDDESSTQATDDNNQSYVVDTTHPQVAVWDAHVNLSARSHPAGAHDDDGKHSRSSTSTAGVFFKHKPPTQNHLIENGNDLNVTHKLHPPQRNSWSYSRPEYTLQNQQFVTRSIHGLCKHWGRRQQQPLNFNSEAHIQDNMDRREENYQNFAYFCPDYTNFSFQHHVFNQDRLRGKYLAKNQTEIDSNTIHQIDRPEDRDIMVVNADTHKAFPYSDCNVKWRCSDDPGTANFQDATFVPSMTSHSHSHYVQVIDAANENKQTNIDAVQIDRDLKLWTRKRVVLKKSHVRLGLSIEGGSDTPQPVPRIVNIQVPS